MVVFDTFCWNSAVALHDGNHVPVVNLTAITERGGLKQQYR